MNKNTGFTLPELLVSLVIISILFATAIASYLNQASKAKEVEAKQTIGALNRAQQSYMTEWNVYAEEIDSLGLSINLRSVNYSYSIKVDPGKGVINLANPNNPQTLRAYVGGVQIILTAEEEATTTGTICQSERPALAKPEAVRFTPENEATGVLCGEGFEPL